MAANTAPRTWTVTDGGIEIEGTWYRAARFEGVLKVLDPCWKCGGSGEIPSFYHVHDGVCFACAGHKGTWRTPAKQEALIRRRASDRARRERKAETKIAEKRSLIDHFMVANADLAFMGTDAIFDDETEMHHILRDMGAKLQQYGSLSEKQIGFARRIIAEQQERQAKREYEAANSKPAPTGRVVVEGLVIKAVEKVSYHGYSEQYNTRITVKTDDGWVANGNAPSALLALVGPPAHGYTIEDCILRQRVRFTATLEVQEEGATFAFFKRPTKPELLTEEVDPVDLANLED